MRTIRHRIILTLVAALGLLGHVKAQGIEFFHGSWAELKAEAKRVNKPIFIDCFTTWCGPCKHMSANVFTQKPVGDFFNQNFVNYKLDMEKGEGPQVARDYRVTFYPTYIFLNPDGELVHRAGGAKDGDKFIKDGQTALNGGVSSLIKEFRNGRKDTAFLYDLIIQSKDIDTKVHTDALAEYWKQVPQEKLIERNAYAIFHDFEFDVNSSAFQYIAKNMDAFTARWGTEDVLNNVYGKALQTVQNAGRAKDTKLFNTATRILKESKEPEAQKLGYQAEMTYSAQQKDWKTYGEAAEKYKELFTKNDPKELEKLLTESASLTDDPALLKKLEGWTKTAMKSKKTPENTYVNAILLFKRNKLDNAEKAAKESIALAQASSSPYAQQEALLRQIYDKKLVK